MVSIENDKIETDLYRKPTDRCQYLLPSSCHPSHITRNIPYSLAYRIFRFCSTIEKLDQRLKELKEMLLSRDYRPKPVDAAIAKARAIPRSKALEKVIRKKNERPVFVITYDPRLPSISKIFKKHHAILIEDPYMKKTFPEPPLTAYRRPQSLRDKLIKAKISPPPNRSSGRIVSGAKKCANVNCVTCPYLIPGKEIKCTVTGSKFEVNTAVSCTTKNIIYCITCAKCNQQYIGETEKEGAFRFAKHRGYVNNFQKHKEAGKRIEATGEHFNLPGHSGVQDMRFQIVEKVFQKSKAVRLIREKKFIQEFQSEHLGINRKY